MSYCRWSDGDLYCYMGVTGAYHTHVAKYRLVGETLEPKYNWSSNEALAKSIEDRKQWSIQAERVEIGLPYDGDSFVDSTKDEFMNTLCMLRSAGYVFPEFEVD